MIKIDVSKLNTRSDKALYYFSEAIRLSLLNYTTGNAVGEFTAGHMAYCFHVLGRIEDDNLLAIVRKVSAYSTVTAQTLPTQKPSILEKLALSALKMTMNYVRADLAEIAVEDPPFPSKSAYDSYLEAGAYSAWITDTLQFCSAYVTDADRADALNLLGQLNRNIWAKPGTAEWNGKLQSPKNSGWAQNDAGNNYNFSFVECEARFALYTGDPAITTHVTGKLRASEDFWDNFVGGGSPEGTGYGLAVQRLYWIVQLLQESGFPEQFPGIRKHASETIFWVAHTTTPTLNERVPIGDQSRISRHYISDTDRGLLLRAYAVADDDNAKQLCAWLLQNTKFGPGIYSRAALFRNELVNIDATPKAPTDNRYTAITVGQTFIRSSWVDKNADYVVFRHGDISQSHMQYDHGHVDLFSGGNWIFTSKNMMSHSGILQDPIYQNVVVFRRGNVDFKTDRATRPIVTSENDGSIIADMSPCFTPRMTGLPIGQTPIWKRRVKYDKDTRTLIIHDFEINSRHAEVIPRVQYNTLHEPMINGKQISVGPAVFTVNNTGDIVKTDWKTILVPNAQEHSFGGYRLDIHGVQGSHLTTIDMDGVVVVPEDPVITAPGNPTLGTVTVDAGTGRVTVPFAAPSTTGGSPITGYTVKIVTSNGVVTTKATAASPAQIDGLTRGGVYTFAVAASNASHTGSYSSASPPIKIPEVVPPTSDKPGPVTFDSITVGLAKDGKSAVARLDYYTGPSSNGGSPVTNYVLKASGSNGAQISVNDPASPALLIDLALDVEWKFTIAAVNANGTGPESAPSKVYTVKSTNVPVKTVPGKPTITNVVVNQGNNSAAVEFTAPTDTGGAPILFYRVHVVVDGVTSVFEHNLSPSTIAITPGKTHSLSVSAVNEVGEGATIQWPTPILIEAPDTDPEQEEIAVLKHQIATLNNQISSLESAVSSRDVQINAQLQRIVKLEADQTNYRAAVHDHLETIESHISQIKLL